MQLAFSQRSRQRKDTSPQRRNESRVVTI